MSLPRHRSRPVARLAGQDGGLAVLHATVLLCMTLLVGIAVVDVAALLRAGRVATAAADGAALAAASASEPTDPTSPRVAASHIARAHGAEMERCDCAGSRMAVTVDLRLLGQLGITAVRATSTATLVPDERP